MARLKTRTVQHLLMLTPAEKADWKTKAAAAGMNLNQYIRHCVARRRIVPTPPAVNYQAVAQLGRIGNNLNQQVKAMNCALACGQELPNLFEAMQVVEEVHALLKALQVELLGLNGDTKEDFHGTDAGTRGVGDAEIVQKGIVTLFNKAPALEEPLNRRFSGGFRLLDATHPDVEFGTNQTRSVFNEEDAQR